MVEEIMKLSKLIKLKQGKNYKKNGISLIEVIVKYYLVKEKFLREIVYGPIIPY